MVWQSVLRRRISVSWTDMTSRNISVIVNMKDYPHSKVFTWPKDMIIDRAAEAATREFGASPKSPSLYLEGHLLRGDSTLDEAGIMDLEILELIEREEKDSTRE